MMKKEIDKPEYLAFTIDLLPKSFKKTDKEVLSLMKKFLKKKLWKANEDFYNETVTLKISCYLENINESLDKIKRFVLDILEGSLLKSKKQVAGIKIQIENINKDLFNYYGKYTTPYIGVTMKRFNEPTDEQVKEKSEEFQNTLREMGKEEGRKKWQE